MQIQPIPAFKDNYLWLLSEGQQAVVVDPGDAAAIQQQLEQQQLTLTAILVTHHHHDHVGGVTELSQRWRVPVFGPTHEAIPARTHALQGGDHVELLGRSFDVLDVPGHTLGHIAYFEAKQQLLFCGDTLFAAGCGRLFEGTPEQMLQSLTQLASLPAETRVYCAHEYTLNNLRFAAAVEPDNVFIQQRLAHCEALRQQHQPTIPFTLKEEWRSNPFLRCDEPSVRKAAEKIETGAAQSNLATFRVLREWKNRF